MLWKKRCCPGMNNRTALSSIVKEKSMKKKLCLKEAVLLGFLSERT